MNPIEPMSGIRQLLRRVFVRLRMLLPRQKACAFGPVGGGHPGRISDIYVINLDRQPERLVVVTSELDRIVDCVGQPLSKRLIRHAACDARTLPAATLAGVDVDTKTLPSVQQAKEQLAKDMLSKLETLKTDQQKKAERWSLKLERRRVDLVMRQSREREQLVRTQEQRSSQETATRQARFNKGLRGLLDRATLRHRKIKLHNEQEAYQALGRDQAERDALIFKHLQQRRTLERRKVALDQSQERKLECLRADFEKYRSLNIDRIRTRNHVRERNRPERNR